MRYRAVAVLAVLLLPSVAEAQRLPRIGSRGVPRSVPLGPQPAIVNQALAYNRMRVSFESYPMISFFNTGSFEGNGGQAEWASGGMGTRADYRVKRLLSLTLDMTSSFLGGPVFTETMELGFRVGPRRSERSFYPFVDARYGYFLTLNGSTGLDGFGITPVSGPNNFINYSQGLGGVIGAGAEYTLTRRFSLTSAVSVARSNMTATLNRPGLGDSYSMTSYRYVIALRYNGVRYNTVQSQ
jgi:hypothetical protein